MLMAAILVFQNDETMAMLAYQVIPVGVQLFPHVNTFFCSNKVIRLVDT